MFPRSRLVLCAAAFVFVAGFSDITAHAARAQPDAATLMLMQRIANPAFSEAAADVTVGALPPGWDARVPLPNVPLLGSTRTNGLPMPMVTIYYNPANASVAFQTYIKTLKANGFAEQNRVTRSGFVVPSPFQVTTLCRGNQGVFASVGRTPDDLRVTVTGQGAQQYFCSRPYTVVSTVSPIPQLRAPAGTKMIPQGSMSLGAARGMIPMTSLSLTEAFISGNFTAAQIAGGLTKQLESAGWRISNTFIRRDSAGVFMRLDRGALHWNGLLTVFKTRSPKVYSAAFNASGAVPSGVNVRNQVPTATLQPLQVTTANEPALLQMVKRLASEQTAPGFPVQVWVGRSPPLVSTSYLPRAKPIGSTGFTVTPRGDGVYRIFYNLSPSAMQSYLTRLKAEGWNPTGVPDGAMGFAASVAPATMLCKKGAPVIAAGALPQSTAVTIMLLSFGNAFPCPVPATGQRPAHLLPELTAPAGVAMDRGNAGIEDAGGASGAGFVTTMPLGALLDAFTPQFTAGGWTGTTASVGERVGTRSFSKTDAKGQHWQAVLTVYRSDQRPDRYYSFLDLTNLTVMDNRRQL